MHFTSYIQQGRMTIVLTGEIDHHYAKAYIQEILTKIEVYSPKTCILDFRDVAFMDSSGIAVVINALRAMAQLEGKLILCGLKEQPYKVFKMSGIDKLVEIAEGIV